MASDGIGDGGTDGDAVKQSDESQGGARYRCEDGLIILTAAFVCLHAAVLQCCTPAPAHQSM